MYMGLMIFSAQVKSLTDSFHSSLTSSYLSTDSAIAECNGSEKSKQHRQQQVHHNHNNNLDQQAVYGQFYFSKDLNNNNIDAFNNTQSNYNSILSEKTPLVPYNGQHKSYYASEYKLNRHNELDNNNNHQAIYIGAPQQQDFTSSIVMKNSILLSKANHQVANYQHFDNKKLANDNNDDFDEHEDNWVSSKWILVPMLPLTLSMKVLTPCKFKNTCWTIWTFLVSIALIGALTYVSVWMVHLFGQTIGIPETVAGMTILSWGTGIPELIASIVLIKKTAQADMAICNTIGSNVIDVSFCLSLPWIVKCIMNKTENLKPEVEIQSSALPWTSFTLLLSVLLLILVFKLHNWTLSFSVGVWLTIIYVTFVVTATYLEYSFSESGLDLMSLFD